MTTVSSARNYRIESNSISMLENALEDNNKVMVSCVHNATITVYDREAGILPTSDARYRTWRMVARNTRLAHRGPYHIYARLNRNTGTGEYIFSQKDYNIDGSLKGDPDSGEQPSYWYILVGEITATDEDAPAPGTVQRVLILDFGVLNTDVSPEMVREDASEMVDKASEALSADIAELQAQLDTMANDGYITPSEKKILLTQWNEERRRFDAVSAYDYSFFENEEFMNRYTDYSEVFDNASYIMLVEQAGGKRGILADMTTTTNLQEVPFANYGFSDWQDMWKKLFTARLSTENYAAEVSKGVADKAQNTLSNMASDLVITAQEKLELYRWWRQCVNDYNGLMARAALVLPTPKPEEYTTLVTVYRLLNRMLAIYIAPGNMDKDTVMTEVTAATYKNNIEEYVAAYANLERAVTNGMVTRINSIESEGVTEDIKKQLDDILADYQEMSGTYTTFMEEYGAMFTQGQLSPTVVAASGLVTTTDYASLFSTAKGPGGKTVADALVATYVRCDPNDNTKVMSGVTMSADQIDFNGKNINISAQNSLTISALNDSNVEYFHLDKDTFRVNVPNFRLDESGVTVRNATIRGFIFHDDSVITPDNIEGLFAMNPTYNTLTSTLVLHLDMKRLSQTVEIGGDFDALIQRWAEGNNVMALAIALPAIVPGEGRTRDEIELARSMSGQTVTIINIGVRYHSSVGSLVERIVVFNDSETQPGAQGSVQKRYGKRFSCKRSYQSPGASTPGGDEIVIWSADGEAFPAIPAQPID